MPRVAAPSPILPPKTAGVLASGSRRQEAEFVLVEASVRSGSGSRSELTPEVRGFPQLGHLQDQMDDNLEDDLDYRVD